MVTMVNQAANLRAYETPSGVLPLAPHRKLFQDYSLASLSKAIDLVLLLPEKQGPLSNAARTLTGQPILDRNPRELTIEAHIDGRDVPNELDDYLVSIGFEPDGFVTHVPKSYNYHRTMKFRVPNRSSWRARWIYNFVLDHCITAFSRLDGNVEAYIELEVYSSSDRVYWDDSNIDEKWSLEGSALCPEIIWIDGFGEVEEKIRKTNQKRADIHIKLSKAATLKQRERLIALLSERGFHHVLTWAGNDICTGEFASAGDAMLVFTDMKMLISRFGGVVEMTVEKISRFWRSSYPLAGRMEMAKLPPLILSLDQMHH